MSHGSWFQNRKLPDRTPGLIDSLTDSDATNQTRCLFQSILCIKAETCHAWQFWGYLRSKSRPWKNLWKILGRFSTKNDQHIGPGVVEKTTEVANLSPNRVEISEGLIVASGHNGPKTIFPPKKKIPTRNRWIFIVHHAPWRWSSCHRIDREVSWKEWFSSCL